MLSTSDLDRARRDVGVFAELLLGMPLWPYQLEAARSRARYRVICAGRQVGKSRLLAVLALHKAFSSPRSTTLIVSGGEVAAKRLLDDVIGMATNSPLLAGSVVDDSSKLLTLSNGSTIRAVPASDKQIRGWSIDLLIVDEAAFIEQEIWRAAEPAIIARPGSRVVLCSSPWGAADHFFRALWTRGMAEPGAQLAAWHWPSSVSPLVDDALLEEIRQRETPAYFEREYLARWTDAAGAYFTTAELEAATSDEWALVDVDDPEAVAACGSVVGGVDWGMRNDANALTVIGDLGDPDERGRQRFGVVYVEERFGWTFDAWIGRLVALATPPGLATPGSGFQFAEITSENNAIGMMPSEVLARDVWEVTGRQVVTPTTTTAKLKEDLFGFAKLLLQQGRLVLPRHPSLLRQLSALEFTQTETGLTKISVPERAGHDDVAMSFALALKPLIGAEMVPVVDQIVTPGDLWPDLEDFGSWVP